MKFMNSKEQVLTIELTSFGKHLLSKGKFHPDSYAFFDDDVLYDADYAGTIEIQNNAQDRIKNNTPQLEPQAYWSGVETEIKNVNEFIRQGELDFETGKHNRLGSKKVQPMPEKHYSLSAPLGTIALDAEAAPAWSINVLKGEISGSVEFKEGSHPTLRIPQIDMEAIEYKVVINQGDALDDPEELELENDIGTASDIGSLVSKFEDGSFVQVFDDFILLEVEEANTFFENENFDIEVFEVGEDLDSGNELLTPLFFRKKTPQVRNNILLDDEEQNTEQPEIDTSYVDFFFDVLVDNEIDLEILCRLGATDRAEGIFSTRELDCKEIEPKESVTLYDTDVTEEQLEDDC